jgi:hypothetical protein
MLRQMAGIFGGGRRETYNCHSPFVLWKVLNYVLIYATYVFMQLNLPETRLQLLTYSRFYWALII